MSTTKLTTRDDHRIAWLAALAITIHTARRPAAPLSGVDDGGGNLRHGERRGRAVRCETTARDAAVNSTLTSADRMGLMVAASLVVHAIIVFGVVFTGASSEKKPDLPT